MLQPDAVQVFELAVVRLGLFEPCLVDHGLVGYLDLSILTRSRQTRLPIVGKSDGHSGFTAIGGIVVYGIGLASYKTTAGIYGYAARDNVLNKGCSISGCGRRIHVVHDRLGQSVLRDVDDGLPRNFHVVLVDIDYGLVDVNCAAFGSDLTPAPVRLAAIGHNDVAQLPRQRKVRCLDIGRIGNIVSIYLARI